MEVGDQSSGENVRRVCRQRKLRRKDSSWSKFVENEPMEKVRVKEEEKCGVALNRKAYLYLLPF